MQKHPFTDDRIGSLLADLIKCTLKEKDMSFKEDNTYKYEVYFTVKDEYLIIGENRIVKLKDKENEGLVGG